MPNVRAALSEFQDFLDWAYQQHQRISIFLELTVVLGLVMALFTILLGFVAGIVGGAVFILALASLYARSPMRNKGVSMRDTMATDAIPLGGKHEGWGLVRLKSPEQAVSIPLGGPFKGFSMQFPSAPGARSEFVVRNNAVVPAMGAERPRRGRRR